VTRREQIAAVADLGFTERQAGFLVTVLIHAGVCVRRQYCAYAHILRGQKVHDFFSRLVARRLMTPYVSAHQGSRLYHIQGKRLYAAIDEPDNRNRRPATLGRAIERLMLLDSVLGATELRWLGTEKEKVEYFQKATTLRPNELPHLGFGTPPRQAFRYFPDKLPIGVTADGRTHVFLYLVNRTAPVDFRAFLHRHVELLRALANWEIRLLVPRHLAKAAPAFDAAAREELSKPLRLDDVDELSWFFKQQCAIEDGAQTDDAARFAVARRRFHEPRFRTLYRMWKKDGSRLVHGTASPVLEDALARGRGKVASAVLARSYHHLSHLVGTA
jgi:hypothetical protein